MFSPLHADSDYFAADKVSMSNLRVTDLHGLIAGLHTWAIAAETRPDWDSPETGRFAHIHDPEGNAIELWEPPTP